VPGRASEPGHGSEVSRERRLSGLRRKGGSMRYAIGFTLGFIGAFAALTGLCLGDSGRRSELEAAILQVRLAGG
jgi:hypothetical protein